MAKLKDKVQNALDESRMLILGAQVLIGFEYRSAFEPGFEKLPHYLRCLKTGALGLMLIAFALLIWPAAYHRIVAKGEDTQDLHRFVTSVMGYALLPFAMGLGMDLYAATERLIGRRFGLIWGLMATLVALFFWYGLDFFTGLSARQRKRNDP
jgi:hypothetical protein